MLSKIKSNHSPPFGDCWKQEQIVGTIKEVFPSVILGESPNVKYLYIFLLIAKKIEGRYDELGDYFGVSWRTIQRSLEKLSDVNLIRVKELDGGKKELSLADFEGDTSTTFLRKPLNDKLKNLERVDKLLLFWLYYQTLELEDKVIETTGGEMAAHLGNHQTGISRSLKNLVENKFVRVKLYGRSPSELFLKKGIFQEGDR